MDFKTPESNENAFSDIINEYDEVGNILSEHFELTDNDLDRVEKGELLDIFNGIIGSKKYNHATFLREMKSAGVKYQRKARCNGKQGCYVGIKRRLNDDEEDVDGI